MIREIQSDEGIREAADVVRRSFRTVAGGLGLTPENCPSHPSFITDDKLRWLGEKGLSFFGRYDGGRLAGFVAVENAGGGRYFIEKVSVLPEFRRRAFGRELVLHALEYIRTMGGTDVSIGIIDSQGELKNWYRGMGFRETATRNYRHLPFAVRIMERALGPARNG